MLVGFGSAEFREFDRAGVNVKVWIEAMQRGDRFVAQGVETYPHFSTVRCEHAVAMRPDVPDNLMIDLYKEAFPAFRRHFHRIAFARKNRLKSWGHVDCLFHIAANFFFDILKRNKIETVIFSNFPHEGSLIILYHLAKALGIETILSMQSNFPSLLWIVRDIRDFGHFQTTDGHGEPLELPAAPETPFYMNRGGKFKKAAVSYAYITLEFVKLAFKILTLYFIVRPHALERNLNRFFHSIEKANGGHPNPSAEEKVSLDEDFVYFPLHLQPELTTDTWGYEYGDQLLALEALSRKLPAGMKIYVKENPMQTTFMREESFFRRLKSIPNTFYVSSEISSFELIRRCSFLATISGTAGWEACLIGKGVVIFGVTWYTRVDGVFEWTDPDCIQKAINHQRDSERLKQSFDAVSKALYPGTVDRDYESIVPDYNVQKEAERAVTSLVSVMNDGRWRSVE